MAEPPASHPIRQGDIYWLDDCPPLHGDIAKRRPVVVISPTSVAKSSPEIVVVACTATALPSDTEAIELPNRQRTPQTRSGLNRPTWAVPEWWLPVPRDRLTDYAGFLRGDLLRRVVEAVMRHVNAGDDSNDSKGGPP